MSACGTCGRPLAPDKMLCRMCGNYTTANSPGGKASESDFVDAMDVKAESTPKILTGEWWDEAWGGTNPGFMPTECVLVAGAPGMGKSTALIQIGFAFARATKKTTYYISSEQTKEEWKTYVDRLNLPIERGMFRVLTAIGSGGTIDEEVFKNCPPGLLILDSVTALCGKDKDAQVVVCDNYKKLYSAKHKCPSLIISHINKEGDLAGLMTMQHNVDGICSLFPNEKDRSRYAGQPVFEFHKHRFGPCHKEYQLIMAQNGLFRAPSKEKMRAGGDVLLAEVRSEEKGDEKAKRVIAMMPDSINLTETERIAPIAPMPKKLPKELRDPKEHKPSAAERAAAIYKKRLDEALRTRSARPARPARSARSTSQATTSMTSKKAKQPKQPKQPKQLKDDLR